MVSQKPEPSIMLSIQGLILLGVVVVVLQGFWRTPDSAPQPTLRLAELDDLAERLSRLERAVASLDGTAAYPAPGVPVPAISEAASARTAVPAAETGELDSIRRQLADLRRRLAWSAGGSPAASRGADFAAMRRYSATNWQAVRKHHKRREEQWESALEEVMFLTVEELLTRFGRPTSVEPDGSNPQIRAWQYSDPKNEIYISFRMLDGYVIGL